MQCKSLPCAVLSVLFTREHEIRAGIVKGLTETRRAERRSKLLVLNLSPGIGQVILSLLSRSGEAERHKRLSVGVGEVALFQVIVDCPGGNTAFKKS